MAGPLRVNLHAHSTFSDGSMPPERLIEALAAAGVRVAALTDHDTTAGLERFALAARTQGIGFITGVEITVEGIDGLHILAYGFDPENSEFQAMLLAHRRYRADRHGDLRHALWRLGVWFAALFTPARANLLRHALPDAAEVIRIIHRAGGTAFLAHPLTLHREPQRLAEFLTPLKQAGLDGIEALHAPYSPETRNQLLQIAAGHNLLVSAGTDFHGFDRPGLNHPGMDCPPDFWHAFARANRLPDDPASDDPATPVRHRTVPPAARHSVWRRFAGRIVFPAVLAISLFLLAIFAWIVPLLESSLLQRKRDTIRELTRATAAMLHQEEGEARQDHISLNQAQERARRRLEQLRFGPEHKDYFWVIDTTPRMVMHPYRPELVGTDLTTFADVRGRKLFVESASIARRQGEGFLQYHWQWNDNPGRVAPKESFVLYFAPWDWVLGTGIYLDDVHAEIARITRRLVAGCLAICAFVATLLAWIAGQTLRIERRRATAEQELHESHEKYAALVQAGGEGSLMVLNRRCVFVSRTMCDMLGARESELMARTIEELFAGDAPTFRSTLDRIESTLRGDGEPPPFETTLKGHCGRRLRAVVSVSRVSLAGQTGFILVARDVEHTRIEPAHPAQHDTLLEELRTSLLFLSEPLRHRVGPMHRCDAATAIRDAVRIMSADPTGVVAVTRDDAVIGIVTDHDLRHRLLLAGRDLDAPVAQIMTSPVLSLPDTAPVHEALATLRQHGINHLGIQDESGQIVALVRAMDLIQFHPHASTVLIAAVRKADRIDDIAAAHQRLPRLVQALLECGARPVNILHITSRLADAIVERLVEFALDDLGPAPASFAFLALGSEGRREQTLKTDQDNAIVYEDPPADRGADAQHYFLALGQHVCANLARAGYAPCSGGVMAQNPPWCRSLSAWKEQTWSWITGAQPQDLLEFNVFFDFRPIAGTARLAAELHAATLAAVQRDAPFFLHMARQVMSYKPPVGFFGNILATPPGAHTLDIKDAMLPIVNFARLYALRHGIDATATLDRLDRLAHLDILRPALRDELAQAFTFLAQLRLTRQSHALATGHEPDNLVDLNALTHIDRSLLKQTLGLLSTVQKKISYEFLGVA